MSLAPLHLIYIIASLSGLTPRGRRCHHERRSQTTAGDRLTGRTSRIPIFCTAPGIAVSSPRLPRACCRRNQTLGPPRRGPPTRGLRQDPGRPSGSEAPPFHGQPRHPAAGPRCDRSPDPDDGQPAEDVQLLLGPLRELAPRCRQATRPPPVPPPPTRHTTPTQSLFAALRPPAHSAHPSSPRCRTQTSTTRGSVTSRRSCRRSGGRPCTRSGWTPGAWRRNSRWRTWRRSCACGLSAPNPRPPPPGSDRPQRTACDTHAHTLAFLLTDSLTDSLAPAPPSRAGTPSSRRT